MTTESQRSKLLGLVFDLITSRAFTHVAWWLLLIAVFFSLEEPGYGFWFRLTNALLLGLFYMGVVYFNLLYLIPEYLSQKKIFRYILLLLVSLLIASPIRTFLFYLKFNAHPDLQLRVLETQVEQYLASLFIVLSSTVLKIISDWLRQQRELRELTTQNLQSEIRFLRSQINPHFLFNTLNSLYALTLKKDDSAPAIVLKLSDMMRYMLYESNSEKVPLKKEVDYIKNYLELEKLRHGVKTEVIFELEGAMSDQKITPLLFIPFIENCFKHGVNKSVEKSLVQLHMKLEDNKIWFQIRNSKPADLNSLEISNEVGGIGLENIKRRLKLLYPGKHHLEIRDKSAEYIVNLELMLE